MAASVQGLGEIGGTRARKALQELVGDQRFLVRETARRTLNRKQSRFTRSTKCRLVSIWPLMISYWRVRRSLARPLLANQVVALR